MVDSEHTAEAGTPAPAPRIAAIDIGSNSVRLVVAEVLASGGYRVLDEERENTRLAASLVATGELSDAAVEATITALRRFLSIANGYGVGRISAIATSAVRDAENGPEFCQRVRRELDLDVEVISSDEEARLAFLSVQRAFDVSGREVAVADIGGGSTEIILASSGLVDQIYTTPLGAVRVAEKCDATGISTPAQLEKLRKYVDRVLKRAVGKPPFVPSMFYGTGGTFTALASMIMAREGQAGQPMWGFRVTGAQIRHLVTDLAQLTLEKRKKVAGLNPARADIIVSGLVIIERIMSQLHVNVVQVHTRGVRDGLLLEMVQAAFGGPPEAISSEARAAAVEQFAKSCGVDLPHAKQVAKIAGSLWQQLAAPLEFASRRSRADRGCRTAGQRRLPDQLRRPSQTQLPPDSQQRARRLRARAVAALGSRGPLPSRQPAEKEARRLSRARRRGSPPRVRRGRHFAAGTRTRSHAPTARAGRSRPDRRRQRRDHRRRPGRCRRRLVGRPLESETL